MNKKQQTALNSVLTAVAAFLLTLVEEPQQDSKSEPPPSGDESGGTKASDDIGDLGDMLDSDDAKAKEQLKKELEKKEAADKKKAEKEAADKKKAEEKAKKEEEAKAKEEAKPEAKPAPTPSSEITLTNPDALLADARAAAIAYAGKHGREALRTLLNEFTKGTIAEIDKAKLPELIQKLRA